MSREEASDPKMKVEEEREKAGSMRRNTDMPGLVTNKEERRDQKTKEDEIEERRNKEAEWMWIREAETMRKTQDLANLTVVDGQKEVS